MDIPGLILPSCDLSDNEQQSDTDQARSPTREYTWSPSPDPRGASATPYKYSSPSPARGSSLPAIHESSSPLQLAPPNNHKKRVWFTEQEELRIVHWLLNHRDEYADRNIPRAEFWAKCGNWIQQEFGKTYCRVDRSIQQLVKKKKQEMDAITKGSGLAIADTDWKQALDAWIEFLNDLKKAEQERKEEQSAARDQANSHRDLLASRMMKRRRTDEPDSQSPIPESSTSPEPLSSRGSSRPRRQGESKISADNLQHIMSSSLSGFANNIEGVLKRQRASRQEDLQQQFRDQNKAIEQRFKDQNVVIERQIQSSVQGQLGEMKNEIKEEVVDKVKRAIQGQFDGFQQSVVLGLMEVLKGTNIQKDI
ncbi:hypothetical protein DTO164E3_6847 [Paecilomyces variotii]|nr:hypothetical protein DTO032I3_7907 [Paecilomyces variotii]KAJ9195311.1 hypothetical protein DTO164E3_6847 [Paecilomyces variotii]KAJ9281284.1 hypothetical protein DTO021D3_1943 [Paecilomyces variotii]KAJ9344948.1 hypothetical protein DTO027B6_2654 [Paecilomyces variotii]KAJ9383356.1 hypothetical protein DTO032I4_5225 [Paecilomyces variotii]